MTRRPVTNRYATGRLVAECVAIPLVVLALGVAVVWCWP